jgi:C2 domain
MTDTDIQAEVLKPSIHWKDFGSGELGKVYVEILGCDSLPNLDVGGFLGNKTDAFVSLVFEDVTARTETIDDCLSPRWMPWTDRAFIFRMAHPSSQLCIGVFDFDGSPIGDHDLVGRVSVDLTNLRRDTEYVLSYNLFPSARVLSRDIMGKITLRLRIELPDERKPVLASLEPPEPVYVNVMNKRDFNVIRQTCLGKYDEEAYSVNTLKSYVEELGELQYALFYMEDALMTLLLWRGHFELEVFGREFKLPVHSFNAFVACTFLVEHPQLVPSFCFAILAWLLIAVMGWRRNSENVWFRCYSYAEIMKKVVLGDSLVPPHDIRPFENIDKVNEEAEQWVKRIEEAQKKAERATAAAKLVEEERLKEMEEIGDASTDIGTKVGGGISIDPVRAALFPIQLMLGMVCRAIRFAKNVIIWQEAYFSFWIATGSAFLAIACVFVPWFWLLKWTSRLVIWTVFGPWMKLLDVYYFSLINPETDEQRELREKAEKLKRKLATTEAADKARQVRESATKLKVMKKYMFGKFAMRIPILKQDRYIDLPLPESSATPFKEKEFSLAELAMEEAGYHRTRIPGQTLVGDMIPMIASDSFTQAPIGKATAHPEKLAKDAPGAGEKNKSDTTATAYVKIGGVVFLAGFVSFFGTPLFVNFVGKITHRDEL